MKNQTLNQYQSLSSEEIKKINGGCQIGDCWPFPFPFPNPSPFPFPNPSPFPDQILY